MGVKEELDKTKKIYVYGCGAIAKEVVNIITSILKKEVKAIVVSEGHKEQEEYLFYTKGTDGNPEKCVIPVLEAPKVDFRKILLLIP